MTDQIEYINAACSAFVIEVNQHKIQGKTAIEYVEKLFGEVDTSVIEEMVDSDTIIKVKAWIGTDKISCIDFHLESAIETVYEAVKNYKP